MTEIFNVDFTSSKLINKKEIINIKKLPQFLYQPQDLATQNRFEGKAFIGWKENSDVTDELTNFLARYNLRLPRDENGKLVLPEFLQEKDEKIFLQPTITEPEVTTSWNEWLQKCSRSEQIAK